MANRGPLRDGPQRPLSFPGQPSVPSAERLPPGRGLTPKEDQTQASLTPSACRPQRASPRPHCTTSLDSAGTCFRGTGPLASRAPAHPRPLRLLAGFALPPAHGLWGRHADHPLRILAKGVSKAKAQHSHRGGGWGLQLSALGLEGSEGSRAGLLWGKGVRTLHAHRATGQRPGTRVHSHRHHHMQGQGWTQGRQ